MSSSLRTQILSQHWDSPLRDINKAASKYKKSEYQKYTDGSTGRGSLAASASSFCSLACLRLKRKDHRVSQSIKQQRIRDPPPGVHLPAILLILGVQLVGLLSLLSHPAGHQLLVVFCGFPQFLLQSREGDLQGVVLILQGLVRPLQVLQGYRKSSLHKYLLPGSKHPITWTKCLTDHRLTMW